MTGTSDAAPQEVQRFEPLDCLITALCTPFTEEGIDCAALRAMLRHQKASGLSWVLIAGSTAEPQCMDPHEWHAYVKFAILCAKECGLKTLVGTGTNCTAHSLELTERAAALGADGCMLTCPWYNKPSPRMVEAHYNAICEAFPGMPMVLYNIPGRSGINMSAETAARVCEKNPNVIGYKEATEDYEQYKALRDQLPPRVKLMCGEDGNLVKSMEEFGFDGLISVTANAAPQEMNSVFRLCVEKRFREARESFEPIRPLIKAMFMEPNPVPVKYAVSKLFGCRPIMRSPLMEASPDTKAEVDALMRTMQLTKVAFALSGSPLRQPSWKLTDVSCDQLDRSSSLAQSGSAEFSRMNTPAEMPGAAVAANAPVTGAEPSAPVVPVVTETPVTKKMKLEA